MKLTVGQRLFWPPKSFRTEGSDLIATLAGGSLFRVPADLDLPGIPKETTELLELELIETANNTLD